MAGQAPRRRALEVLRECGIYELPVDIEEVARRRGIAVRTVRTILPGVYGAFFIDGAEGGILLSEECFSLGHRRFTLAHELGHFLLDGHVEELLPSGSGQSVSLGGNFRDQRSKTEREADVFASELLMPRDLLSAHVFRDASLDAVRRLATLCATSLSSAAIRGVELADHPAAAVLSHEGTIEWYACSPTLREHLWARQGLKGEWIPPQSATRRVVRSGRDVEAEIQDEASLLLCEWFPGAPAMCRVREDCLRMRMYGRVLTMLRPVDLPDAEEFEEERQREVDRSREADWRDPIRGWSWD